MLNWDGFHGDCWASRLLWTFYTADVPLYRAEQGGRHSGRSQLLSLLSFAKDRIKSADIYTRMGKILAKWSARQHFAAIRREDRISDTKHPAAELNVVSRATTPFVSVTCEEHPCSAHRNLINFGARLWNKMVLFWGLKDKLGKESHTRKPDIPALVSFFLFFFFFSIWLVWQQTEPSQFTWQHSLTVLVSSE